MSKFSDLAIRIGADWVGAPAFKKADTSIDKLYKTTKKLAASFGIAFSADRMVRFGASAVREFASAEREAQTLLGTMKSLNLAFAAPELGQFLDDLERLTGINRAELQPALQKLVTQTGSVTKAQEILNTAVKVSFSGLMDVSTAANILTQAYVGNTKGLRQFNLGLTTTEISLMSFEQILGKVASTYDGQFAEALDSTTVKLNKVRIAAENAKESIGEGLVNAFSSLAGGGDIDTATSKLEKFGEVAGRIIGNLFTPTKVGDFYLPIPNLLKKSAQQSSIGSPASWREKNVALAKAEAAAAARTKKLEDAKLASLRKQTAEKRAQAAVDKANKALSAANAMFDPQGIQIAAALQGRITEDQRKRLELMQKIWELEQAIDSGNTALIEKLTAQLLELTKQTEQLNKNLEALNKINELLNQIGYGRKLFDLENIDGAISRINQLTGASFTAQSFARDVPEELYEAFLVDLPNAAAEQVVVPEVNVTITENANKLVDIITETTQQSTANGSPIALYRNALNLAW